VLEGVCVVRMCGRVCGKGMCVGDGCGCVVRWVWWDVCNNRQHNIKDLKLH